MDDAPDSVLCPDNTTRVLMTHGERFPVQNHPVDPNIWYHSLNCTMDQDTTLNLAPH